MISRLRGKLVEAELTAIVVDVGGVGYELSVPLSTFDHLPRCGEEVQLYTQLSVREDAWQLYGFGTPEERALFRLVTTVSGIGPRLALNVLSTLSVSGFCRAVADEDVKALSRVSGIGKRSAERLVVELRDKVAQIAPAATLGAAPEGGTAPSEVRDATAALETLGFKRDLARKTIETLCRNAGAAELTAESLIRKALAVLNS